jgi:hypothetical protein
MNLDELREKIKIAHDAVSDENEPYKLEAFKIILQYSLEGIKKSKQSNDDIGIISQQEENNDEANPLLVLSKKCDISVQEIKNVLDYENHEFILLKKIVQDTDVKKQVLACQIILTAYMKGLNQEWTKASVLWELISKNNLGRNEHLAKNLTGSGIVRNKGQGKASEYSLTTEGWQEGLKLIATLGLGK